MSMIRSYQNDAIASGDAWDINIEEDKTWRGEIIRLEQSGQPATFGVQVKNGSNEAIKVQVEGSSLAELIIAKKQSEAMVIEGVRGVVIVNAGTGTIPKNALVVTVTSGATRVSGAAGLGDIYVTEDFGGEVFQTSITATADAAFRLATTETKMRDVLIYVTGQNAFIGDSTDQVQPLNVGESIGLSRVDISTLYFKNAGAGLNTTIILTGVLV